jgi:hypothetical protein
MQWFRLWHGFLQSPKWTLVAQRAGCQRGDVLNVALFLLDYAARNADRGSIKGIDLDECEVVTGVTRNVTERCVTEITRLTRSPLMHDRWVNWDEYQPRDGTAAERMRRHRAKQKQEDGGEQPEEASATIVTLRPVTRNVTPEQNRTEKNKKESRTPNGALDGEFDAFWDAYPKRVGKAAAQKAFAKARKTGSLEAILHGVVAADADWNRRGTERQYIPNPATWLNQARWLDEPEQPKPRPYINPQFTL